ncbi:MAG: metallopeptidase family protein [bacterium]|nr:metallopeptidase family protein [bacterium]
MKRNMFEHLVVEAMAALPLRVREAMSNVAIVIKQEPRRRKSPPKADQPLAEKIKRHDVLLGLYEGIPLTGRNSGYFGVLPDKITIFQQPIEELAARDEKKLKKMISEVVWHEIGHHFGLSDPELDALEEKHNIC